MEGEAPSWMMVPPAWGMGLESWVWEVGGTKLDGGVLGWAPGQGKGKAGLQQPQDEQWDRGGTRTDGGVLRWAVGQERDRDRWWCPRMDTRAGDGP